LIEVFNALAGHIRGGAAIITVFVCAFFTSFTGASGVTILALGGLLMPVLIAEKLPDKKALGLLTGAGSLGLLLPPCLPLILYAVIASTAMANMGVEAAASTPQVNMERMFLAGIGPSILMMALTIGWGMWRSSEKKETVALPRFDGARAVAAIKAAKWELLLPLVALGSLFGGFATPIEAAAITAAYAFTIEVWVYGDLSIRKDLIRVTAECGLLIGGVLMILGVAMGLTHYLISMEVPFQVVAWAGDWAADTPHAQLKFLLLLNVFLLIVGCMMDIFSALVVVVPLILPVGLALGIDPVHLGIIFMANLELGYLTPPVGMNLFLASYRFEKTVPQVSLAVLPLFFVLLVGVLLITYWPGLSTWLPNLLLGSGVPSPG
jgi:tripartite ATP-independent transporter DctM subunit